MKQQARHFEKQNPEIRIQNKVAQQAGSNTQEIASTNWETKPVHKHSHQNHIPQHRDQPIREVELPQPAQSPGYCEARSIAPGPSLMPHKVIEHSQFNRDDCCQQVMETQRLVR